jgi:hypothetical protein
MYQWADTVLAELRKRNKFVIPVVEIYPRSVEDITSIGAPANAIGRFSNVCYTWTNSTGSYTYDAKILSFPSISTYISGELNSAEIKFGNATRGEGSMSRFVLDNKIKGCWLVIRLIFPDSYDDSVILFWGKCARPGEIDSTTLVISATQDIGNSAQEVPFRNYQSLCPLEFAREGSGCLGNQTLAEKSIQFQQRVELYGTGGCNKTYSTCSALENTNYFQGQRQVAVSGQFSYITVEEVVKRVLFWTKRKKIKTIKTDSWSSVNQSEGNETIPLPFGRCQIEGHPMSWADVGEQVRSLQGFCEGKITGFNFVRSRTEGINIVSYVEHLGDWGGVGTQQPETLFNGAGGPNSKLAYLEILTDGSSPSQVDDAPLITAVIRGIEIPTPDPLGDFNILESSSNPAYITRFLLTDLRFGRIPEYRIDDECVITTAVECDEIVEDRTNDEAVLLPANEADNYGVGYRRFRSEGRYSAYKDMYSKGEIGYNAPVVEVLAAPLDPAFEEPEIRWFSPFEPYAYPRQDVILRQKYTCNGALQEKTSLLDFLYKRILPTYKGFIAYSPNGKIQIKTRKKATSDFLRYDTAFGATRIAISNVRPWIEDTSGYALIGVSLPTAEIRQISGFDFSTTCNDMPVTAVATGTVTATTSSVLSGGSASSPATGYIDIGGTVTAYDKVEVTFSEGDGEFKISYIADGIESPESFARMLAAFMNAHLQFKSFLTAYILPSEPARIMIRCEAGYLNFYEALEYDHATSEEVLRVQHVLENCGEVGHNTSAQFDNIIDDSFKWNTDEEDEINAISATYTSAIDDFHLTKLLPRAAWDTIDMEGEIKKEEIDLTFVDNYWQAAYLTKCEAIERIDGNLHFKLSTDLTAARLELGDVIAIRHDSGDGALNYVPAWVTAVEINLDEFKVNLTAKLYLSAAHDLHVQPIDVLLTTTLNSTLIPDSTPATLGTNGGISTSTEPNITRPEHNYYSQFNISKYSVNGLDVV